LTSLQVRGKGLLWIDQVIHDGWRLFVCLIFFLNSAGIHRMIAIGIAIAEISEWFQLSEDRIQIKGKSKITADISLFD